MSFLTTKRNSKFTDFIVLILIICYNHIKGGDFMAIIQKRKLLRLYNFDYNSPGAYFITFCTHDRNCILSKIVEHKSVSHGVDIITPELLLSNFGCILDTIIQTIPERYNVIIDSYVIMPNHVHIIINFPFDCNHDKEFSEHRSLISKIIGFIKMNSSREIHKICHIKNIWQRGYHDHVIRNPDDYMIIAKYIKENPKRWFYDKYYTSD